jgi:hypothetical protein
VNFGTSAVTATMAAMNFVTFNQDHSHLGVGMSPPSPLRSPPHTATRY